MLTTAQIQGMGRPLLDKLFAALGQTVTVYRAQVPATAPGAQPPPEYDERGELVTPAPADPTPTTPGAGVSLGDFPCMAAQLDAKDKADLGGEIAVPLWEVYVHWSAPLDEPGLHLVVTGGEVPEPLHLTPIGDVVDETTQRVVWVLTARATQGRSA
ncbi:hypothetical protein GO986_18695 [Deinococcus sp. HMF7620]|uniref:Uncharacterized protein n=1 Tax=Deinococcus arboris TaxID=2682977 RepID=A0A7C9I596_9DEIO|nr:hypothetical protein [Deinococcus arboris]MVN88771.1 hypothetical protein [Deinococcus arboris]